MDTKKLRKRDKEITESVNISENACVCKKTNCIRHGKCSECREFHSKRNSPPRCER